MLKLKLIDGNHGRESNPELPVFEAVVCQPQHSDGEVSVVII
jgi:hypothetical protein